MERSRLRLTSLLMAAILLFLTACGTNSSTDTGSGDGANREISDTLTVAFKVEPPTLDYVYRTGLVMSTINQLIFDRLIDMDAEGNVIPGVATEWEQVDELTFHFTIRDDVYFHNGEKMTVDDVVYTLQRLTWADGTRTQMVDVIDAENTKALSDTEVELKLLIPYAPILSRLASASTNIVPKSVVEEMGEEAFGRAPIGSGPMKFDNWVPGDSITLIRNEDYWGTPTSYSKCVCRFITEATTRATEVEVGGVDISLDILSTDVERLNSSENAHAVIVDGVRSVYFGFNMNFPPVDDERVRQAFAYALDLDTIIAGTYEGDVAKAAKSPIPATVKWSIDASPYSYDPEKAKELLAEAGYADGLDIELWVVKDDALYSIAQIAQNMWADVGINVELIVNDTTTVQNAGFSGEIPMWLYNQTYSPFDPDGGMKIFQSGEISIINSTDQTMEDMIYEARSTYVDEEREELYAELQTYIMEKCYAIPVVYTSIIYGVKNNVENFDADISSDPNLREVIVYK